MTTNQVAKVEFVNDRQGKVVITKRDKESNALLQGATYQVKSGTNVVATLTTGANGTITSGFLTAGAYTVTETAAPTNYALDSVVANRTQNLTITKGGTAQLTFLNLRQKGGIEVIKKDDAGKVLAGATYVVKNSTGAQVATGTTNASGSYSAPNLPTGTYTVTETAAPAGHILLTGTNATKSVSVTTNQVAKVEFVNDRQGKVVITKRDKESNALLQGATYQVKSGTNVVATLTTGANGTITSGFLTAGAYTVTETAAPTNYALDSVVANRTQNLTITKGGTAQLTFLNLRQKGSLEVIKKDDAGKVLAGATYVVKNSTGAQVATGTTNASGSYSVPNLPTGTYAVTETAAPAGHVLLTGAAATKSASVTTNQVAKVEFVNDRQGKVVITKRDKESNALLQGASYQVKSGTKVVATLTTGANGTITSGFLTAGAYTVTETAAPTNYALDETVANRTQNLTITKGGTAQLTFLNLRQKGGLQIIKVDKGDPSKRLAGAVFDIASDSKGQTIIYSDQKTSAAGEINLPNLTTGDYYIKEKVAPTGYRILKADWQKVTVVTNKTAILIVENQSPQLHVRQVILEPNKELVVPQGGFVEITKNKNQVAISLYRLKINSSLLDEPTEITQSLFTTIGVMIDNEELLVATIIPEYYEYVGAIKTDKDQLDEHSSSLGAISDQWPITLDYSQTSEYWITVFITPQLGFDPENNPVESPRPYSWSGQQNKLGQLVP